MLLRDQAMKGLAHWHRPLRLACCHCHILSVSVSSRVPVPCAVRLLRAGEMLLGCTKLQLLPPTNCHPLQSCCPIYLLFPTERFSAS